MKKYSGEENRQAAATPLAIVGIGCLFPQAEDKGTFWTNIKNGTDAIIEVPESHWRSDDYFDPDPKAADKVYAKYGGFLAPVDFNPMEYGVLPNALEAIDTSQLLGLVAVDQALQDAGYTAGKEFDRDRVSVILGVTGTLELVVPLGARLGHPRWREALKDAGIADAIAEDVVQRISDSYVPWQENSFPGLLGNVVAGRISKHFDFGGTNCVVDAACGSSLSAL
ncbi:MAG: beta-ketoacyl synthase N-terminal-like domain-containing protein, partial [Desulfuromonadales bacterium]